MKEDDMKTEEFINVNNINVIKIFPRTVSEKYVYVDYYIKTRFFFKKNKKPLNVFRDCYSFTTDYYTKEDILTIKCYGQKIYEIEDNIVYERPYVCFVVKGNKIYNYFDTTEQAKEYVNKFLKNNKLQNILVQLEKGD